MDKEIEIEKIYKVKENGLYLMVLKSGDALISYQSEGTYKEEDQLLGIHIRCGGWYHYYPIQNGMTYSNIIASYYIGCNQAYYITKLMSLVYSKPWPDFGTLRDTINDLLNGIVHNE